MTYLLRFDFPEGQHAYAGMAGDAAGFAPTPATALVFDDEAAAERMLRFAYPDALAEFGEVVRLVPEAGER